MGRYVFLIPVAIAILIAAVSTVTSDDKTPIPTNINDLNQWFQTNVGPLSARKATMNATLVAAEANPKTIKVRQDGSGDFKTLTDAIQNISVGNSQRLIIDIGPGVYQEKLTLDRSKPFVTLRGSPGNMPTLSFAGTAKQFGTVYSATIQIDSDFFTASNVIFKNSAPRPDGKMQGAQAVALRITGDKAAFYSCRFIGFQDTLCDDKGNHLFKDCYVEGTVDFIFGNGRSLYLNTELFPIADQGMTVITAQARDNQKDDTGYLFMLCKVTGIGTGAYLGRTWMEMPRVVFAYTSMSNVVNPAGWFDSMHPQYTKDAFFGEYQCTGEGSRPNGRVQYSKMLSQTQIQPALNLGFILGSEWRLLPPPQ